MVASSSSSQMPGPDADAAFALGLKVSVVLVVLAVVCSFHGGFIALLDAVVLFVLCLPVAIIVASCLLAPWLGYSPDTEAAIRQTRAGRERLERGQ